VSGSARFFNYGAHFFHLDFILAHYGGSEEQGIRREYRGFAILYSTFNTSKSVPGTFAPF
jgi:hypothetical protein